MPIPNIEHSYIVVARKYTNFGSFFRKTRNVLLIRLMQICKARDHTCERKTFRKYKEVKHGQTMLLTSHNALKARNHFFTKEICVFY